MADEQEQHEREPALFTDPHRFASDLRMCEHAIRKRYPISDEIKAEMVANARELMNDKSVKDTVRVRAVAVLTAMEKMIQTDEIAAIASGLDLGAAPPAQVSTERMLALMLQTVPRVEQTGT